MSESKPISTPDPQREIQTHPSIKTDPPHRNFDETDHDDAREETTTAGLKVMRRKKPHRTTKSVSTSDL